GHIEHYISESSTVVLIPERHQSLEVFLQVRSVVLDRFVLAPRVAFAVIALHAFRRSTAPASVEVNCHKSDSASGEFVAFRQDCGLRRGLSWFQGLVIALLSVFHGLILPNWRGSGLIGSRRSFRARNRTTMRCSTAPDVLAEALRVSGSDMQSFFQF